MNVCKQTAQIEALGRCMIVGVLFALAACDADAPHAAGPEPNAASTGEWRVYGGSTRGDRYSALTQITPANVHRLKIAWRYDMAAAGESQTSPLMIGRRLFAYTPDLKVIALDAAKGQLLWTFDAHVRGSGPHRGLAYWSDGRASRLLAGVMNYLCALDPASGRPFPDFGRNGCIDLREGLGRDPAGLYVSLTKLAGSHRSSSQRLCRICLGVRPPTLTFRSANVDRSKAFT